MEIYTIIVLIFGILCLILLGGIYFINRIFQYKQKIDKSFITIKEHLNERENIIDKMLEFINNNVEHEQNYYKRLFKTKEDISNIKNNQEGISLLKKTAKEVVYFNLLENTYKELIKNEEYQQIKKSITTNQERLIYALDTYDKGVINYNNYKENKLINILTKICHLPEYSCYNK